MHTQVRRLSPASQISILFAAYLIHYDVDYSQGNIRQEGTRIPRQNIMIPNPYSTFPKPLIYVTILIDYYVFPFLFSYVRGGRVSHSLLLNKQPFGTHDNCAVHQNGPQYPVGMLIWSKCSTAFLPILTNPHPGKCFIRLPNLGQIRPPRLDL